MARSPLEPQEGAHKLQGGTAEASLVLPGALGMHMGHTCCLIWPVRPVLGSKTDDQGDLACTIAVQATSTKLQSLYKGNYVTERRPGP